MSVFHDAKRPAADGRWVSIHRHGCIIEYRTWQTETEARAAVEADRV